MKKPLYKLGGDYVLTIVCVCLVFLLFLLAFLTREENGLDMWSDGKPLDFNSYQ